MNSDNFNNLFKEQVSSLDQVAMPGVKWTPEQGWEEVASNLNKPRRRIIFWFSAAAMIIILLGFYFLADQTNKKKDIFLTETSTNTEAPNILTESLPGGELTGNSMTNQEVNSGSSLIEKKSEPGTEEVSRRALSTISPLKQITANGLQNPSHDKPGNMKFISNELVASKIKQKSKSLNRTYVFSTPQQHSVNTRNKKKNFSFRFGAKKEPSSSPPKGLLAGL